MKKAINYLAVRKADINLQFDKLPTNVDQYVAEVAAELQEELRQIDKALLVLSNFVDRLPEDTVIRDNAREMDEKEFEHWWWETVYKGN
jgi:hypothetical protein